MLQQQGTIKFSEYAGLYDIVVPQDHEFRKWDELCDGFQFVYDELKCKYCLDNGRTAVDPRILFKYLLLKVVDGFSDVDIVKHSRYDMAYKWFLGLMPEDDVIDPSLLTKFRRQRLQDINLLDLLISKSISIAKENGLLKSKTLIVDSTHTVSRYTPQSQVEELKKRSAALRKSLYGLDEKIKSQLPEKYDGVDLEKELEYENLLIEKVKTIPFVQLPVVYEKLNFLSEAIDDIRDHYTTSIDQDARIGHKTADTEFFGYKTHIAITEEGLISAATITSGERSDGPELPKLIDKSIENGIDVEDVIGDGAYSDTKNLENAKKMNIKIIAKLKPNIALAEGSVQEGFVYNKDADMYVCPAGHMAIRKERLIYNSCDRSSREVYHFSRKKCKVCALRDECWSRSSLKHKAISVLIRQDVHQQQMEYEKTEEFKEKYRQRYMIESKNADLKNNYGYRKSISYGINAMEMQGAVTLFTANMRRIMRMIGQKTSK